MNDNLVGSNTRNIIIYNDKGEIVVEKVGKLSTILKEHKIPLSFKSAKNKPYVVNTYHKNQFIIDHLKKYEGWYYESHILEL
jgi:hypothetical protein